MSAGDDDLWSPRAVRLLIAVAALVPAGIAGAGIAGWIYLPTWLTAVLITVAVVALCAAVTPAFRQPRP